MAFRIITPGDLEGVGVAPPFSIEPSAEGMDPTDLQDKFEETVRTLAIPAYNELAEKLNDGRGVAEMVARDPVSGAPTTVQGALDGGKAYTDQKVEDIGAGDMAMAVYDPAPGAGQPNPVRSEGGIPGYVMRRGIVACGHEKTGTVHALTGENIGPNIKFVAAAGYSKGDTFTLNGAEIATQTQDGKPLFEGAFVEGAFLHAWIDEMMSLLTIAEADSKVGGMYVFSKEEVRIGTWIDGKPLYRKILLSVVPSSSSAFTVPHGVANIGFKCVQLANMGSSPGLSYDLPIINMALPANNMLLSGMTSTAVVISPGGTAWAGYPLTIAIIYTKTTD